MSFLRVLRATSRKKLILISATEERVGSPAPALAPALGRSSLPARGQGGQGGQGRRPPPVWWPRQEQEGPPGLRGGMGPQDWAEASGREVAGAFLRLPRRPRSRPRPLFLECSLYIAFGITTAGFLYGEGLSGRRPPVPALCVTSCTRRETVILLAPCGVFPCFVTM